MKIYKRSEILAFETDHCSLADGLYNLTNAGESGRIQKTMKALPLILLALTATGCNSSDRIVRYKFTIEVDDNGTTRRGSTVQEHVCSFNDGLLKGMGNALNCGTAGEALFIDLGEKGTLFALMAGDLERKSFEPMEILFQAANGTNADGTPKTIDNISKVNHRIINFPVSELPLLVRFRDINNPDSVERVDPLHLDKEFGNGVKINSSTVELSDETISIGISKKFHWLSEYYRRSFYLKPDESDPYKYSIRLDSGDLANPERKEK